MKKINLILFAIISLFISCTAQNSSDNYNISAEEFHKKTLEDNIIILDVRTPAEVAKGKIPNSINIDFYDNNFSQKTTNLDKSKTILVYCAVGGRSTKAMNFLTNKGYTVYNLNSGFNGWSTKGLPIVK